MKALHRNFVCGTVGALLVSCLTVNINFPAAEIEESAERIIDEVRPEEVPIEEPLSSESETEAEREEPGDPPETTGARATVSSPRAGVLVALGRPGRTATAEEEKDEILDDPRVKKIVEALKKRYVRLLSFYERGALGENRKGYIDTRDLGGLTLKEKNTLRKLHEAENKDRKNLYERIAVLKGVEPDRLKDIEAIYAEKWIAKARKGWWVQDKKGNWIKKDTDPEKTGNQSPI